MNDQFIHPNWHVILIHYPIGLLTMGLIIELLAFLWPKGGFRAAGRWMILLGTLLLIPTATAGIYAMRQVVGGGEAEPDTHFHDLVSSSPLSGEQWHFLQRHYWLNGAAAVVLLVMVVIWIASSSSARRKLYWPLLILLLCGVGLLGTSAWYGGEMVYRDGTAVSGTPSMGGPGGGESAARKTLEAKIEYYVPPLQLHLVLAGLAVAFVVGAFGLTMRRMEPTTASTDVRDQEARDFLEDDPSGDRRTVMEEKLAGHGVEKVTVIEPPTIFPGRFWVVAFLVALGAAVAGAWAVMGTFSGDAIRGNLHDLREPAHGRLLVHVITGACIIILPLILAALVWLVRLHRFASSILSLLLLLAIAAQVYGGTLMLFDSLQGPLIKWNPPGTASHPHQPGPATKPTEP